MNFFSVFIFYTILIIIIVCHKNKGNALSTFEKVFDRLQMFGRAKRNYNILKKKTFLFYTKKAFYISPKNISNNKHRSFNVIKFKRWHSCEDKYNKQFKIFTKNSLANNEKMTYDKEYLSYLKGYIINGKDLEVSEKGSSIYQAEDNKKNDEHIWDIETVIDKAVTQRELELFEFLMKVNEQYKLDTTLRVVGGWVRDKFLNISNDDIDITVDNMKGSDFCNYIKEYIKDKENKNFNFGIIKINSDQSKHLETSSFNLFNFQVDIVNLRNETYTEESRIPEIAIGTPEEDALRRDFTVNSLFYNLKNKKVEDYTKNGIHHLKNQIISTPLNPLTTFLDDPLRIIRCIRFCGYFNFNLDQSIFDVLKNEDIKKSFNKKISKSRLASEIIKIFSYKCKNIVLSLTLLNYSNYSEEIFKLPLDYFVQNEEVFEKMKNKKNHKIEDHWYEANGVINKRVHLFEDSKEINKNLDKSVDEYVDYKDSSKTNLSKDDNKSENLKNPNDNRNIENDWLFEGLNYVKFFKGIEKSELLKQILYDLDYKENINYIHMCLFLLPLKNYYIYIKKGVKTEYVIEYIIRESLKFPLKYSKFCVNIYEGFTHLYKLYKNINVLEFLKDNNDKKTNLNIKGDVVVFLKNVGDKWDLLILIFYIFHKYNELNKNFINIITNDIYLSDFAIKLYQYILKNDIQKSYNIKPFLKWPNIKHHFPNIAPNRINEVYEQIIHFTCIHGEKEEECIEFLKKHFNKPE
ncbi:tRNA nucleotidyltransferase, putative [Plasmodium vinckei brucechwatti]|uniref:tRNA nucleotidyltransferase, putative n=1 Tax=Plasmodium vinckei brucechwatti TaxID=119398 RepID=A0A6V7S3X4_PLAVN|nr:tRNA nucleotidyltransferase, putative [Plasmodium vinckei brucechwatti]